jgi:hypothetical protein
LSAVASSSAALEKDTEPGGRGARVGQLVAFSLNKAPANRKVNLPSQQRSIGTACRKAHALGVAGQHQVFMKDKVARFLEGSRVNAEKQRAARAADFGDMFGGPLGIRFLGPLAGQTQEYGTVGTMADSGERQRAVQLGRHFVGFSQLAGSFQPFDKGAGGAPDPWCESWRVRCGS